MIMLATTVRAVCLDTLVKSSLVFDIGNLSLMLVYYYEVPGVQWAAAGRRMGWVAQEKKEKEKEKKSEKVGCAKV